MGDRALGIARQALRPPERAQDPRILARLPARALEQAHGGIGRPARQRALGRRAQALDHPGVPSRLGGEQVDRRSVRARGLAVQHLGGAPVGSGAPGERQVGVDRGAHDRVQEPQRTPRRQHPPEGQPVRRGLRLRQRDAGERGGVAQLGVDVEHRDRVRQSQCPGTEPAQSPDDRLGHPLRSQFPDQLDRHGLGVLRERAQELSEQQRVASGGVVARPPDAGAGRLAEHRAGERDHDAVAEGSRSEDGRPGGRAQVVEQHVVR
jgi:hypothetical protein